MKSMSNFTMVGYSPLFICLSCLLVIPISWDFYTNVLIREDRVTEYATVIFALIAAILAIRLALILFKKDGFSYHHLLLFLFSGSCIFFAGEEISWGQRIFGIKTEEVSLWLMQVNIQNETNLHNIKAFAKVRIIADMFCLIWGIIVPYFYREKMFPISFLRYYKSPQWLIPGFVTCLLITLPLKISETFFGEIQLMKDICFGELKELSFGCVLMLYAFHLLRKHSATDS